MTLTRRNLFQGAAGLMVAFSLPPTAASASPATVAADSVDGYLAVAPDGSVTVFAGKVDLGTGARAALRQIVAEELGVSPGAMNLVEGDTGLTPDQGGTGGSTGISVGAVQIRQAAATARAALLQLAAGRIGVPEAALSIAGTTIRATDGRSVDIGELIGGRTLGLSVNKNASLKDPATYAIVGTSYARPDLPAKLTARHTYVQDHRVDGMLHARVVRPPAIGAHLLDVDAGSIAAIPGARVVRVKDFLAVVAPREWDAVRAMRALQARWSDATTLAGSDALFKTVRDTPVAREEVLRATAEPVPAAVDGLRVLQATYHWPIQSHASIGPSCAVADIRDGGGTVWTASQNTHRSRRSFARLLGLDPAKLRLVYMDGSGSYGSNGNDDAAFEAALISREIGVPVRVQWMRSDEHGWDPKGPPQLLDLRGALDTNGDIAMWETVAMVPANTTSAGTPLLAAAAAGLDTDAGMSAGLTSLNADPPYAVPHIRTTIRWLAATPLRPSNLRAPGKVGNVFAVESFFDELAAAAQADPLEYRLRRLPDLRGREVLTQTAKMMAWTSRGTRPDRSGPILRGRGLAYVHYKQTENYVGMGMDVEVERATGTIRVTRVVCAHDCGMIVNPDAVRAQVEGCILQTLSRTLFEQVTFDRSVVTSTDWATYPILTFPDVPRLEIALIDRRMERPLGAGEAAAAPVAAALGNAVFDATGVRLREAPFIPTRVKAAMAGEAS
jgi:CO/xanthine dehydrogenase Mo-binding subunit